MGLGAAMAGGNPAEGRQEDDFYPTPEAVTQALFSVERFDGAIYDPACGDGAMIRVFQEKGFKTLASDINPRGAMSEAPKRDFLAFKGRLPANVSIVTNPPFNLAEAFILKAHELECKKLCLVLKSTYWHAASRRKLWRVWQPKAVYPLTWRPDFLGKGRPTMEVAWHVWERGRTGPTTYLPLARPE
jgi:hypothetical protein